MAVCAVISVTEELRTQKNTEKLRLESERNSESSSRDESKEGFFETWDTSGCV